MAVAVTVSSAETCTAACLARLRLIQVPLLGVQELLAQGWPACWPITWLSRNRRRWTERPQKNRPEPVLFG